jgi:hypothetical protein
MNTIAQSSSKHVRGLISDSSWRRGIIIHDACVEDKTLRLGDGRKARFICLFVVILEFMDIFDFCEVPRN